MKVFLMKFDFERGGQYHKTLTIQYIFLISNDRTKSKFVIAHPLNSFSWVNKSIQSAYDQTGRVLFKILNALI